jgi:hypothetical protein
LKAIEAKVAPDGVILAETQLAWRKPRTKKKPMANSEANIPVIAAPRTPSMWAI